MTETSGWPDGATLALSLVVNVEEGSEMSLADGDPGPDAVDELGVALRKPVRNFGNESNYRYGLKAGAPRILALLRRYGVPATFTAAALSLERAPDLARRIVADGHEVCSHGWRWVHQYRMEEDEERAFIRRAVDSIEQTTGQRPRGWLSRYLFTPNTRRLLVEAGFAYHMDDYSDDVPFWDHADGRPILVMPYALDSNDMKMWTAPAFTPADWLQYAIDTFDWLREESAQAPRMMSLGVHLRIIGRPGRIGYLERFVRHVRRHERVWIATRAAIAEHWARAHPPGRGAS
jgi:peptidoglycan/xylan/chitin deacetylase (PgdA/CDA1 family)